MITLTGQREIEGCAVYRDDVDPLAFYVLPQEPRIALDESGKPLLSMVWYRRDVADLTEEERRTRLGGGLLSASVELSATDGQLTEIRRQVAADPQVQHRLGATWRGRFEGKEAKLAEALKISTLPVKDGTVQIGILGESPDGGQPGEFVTSLIGVGRVSMVGRQRASFMAKLSQEGAVLLWEMLERDLAAIRVAYDLVFDHRLDAVRMSVWCDAQKTFHAVQEQWQHLNDDASFSQKTSGNTTTLRFGRDQSMNARDRIYSVAQASQTSGIEIIPEAGGDVVPPELIQTLTESGTSMIQDFLAATFLQWNPGEGFTVEEAPTLETELPEYQGRKYGHHGIDYYNLRTWDESMQARLEYNFKTKAVIESHRGPNANLAGVLAGRDPNEFRTQVELDDDWYKYLDVEVVCTADFANDPVDLVKAHLAYSASGSQGRVDEVKDFVFQPNTPPQHFLAYLADPRKKTYRYEYEVFYKGSDDTFTVRGETDETILVLDTDRMGVLQVDVMLGLVDWEKYRSVHVEMWYGSGGARKETEFVLDKDRQEMRWNEVIARAVDEPYHYRTTFVDRNNQRLVLEPESSRSKRLVIAQPTQESLEVAIVPAGSFGGDGLISQVVAALRYRDGDYRVDDVVTLAKAGDSKVWEVPLLNPDRRTYEYRTTVFYSDGVTREDDWATTDKTVLALGDPFGYRVQIAPYLLKDRGYAFGTLHLEFDDREAQIHAEKTLEINDFGERLFWRFRLGAPGRHTYRYQLTLFTTDGDEVALPPAEADKEVLVLRPPAR